MGHLGNNWSASCFFQLTNGMSSPLLVTSLLFTYLVGILPFSPLSSLSSLLDLSSSSLRFPLPLSSLPSPSPTLLSSFHSSSLFYSFPLLSPLRSPTHHLVYSSCYSLYLRFNFL